MIDLARNAISTVESGPQLDSMVERLSSTWKVEWETDKDGTSWLNATFPRDHGAAGPLLRRRILITQPTEAKDG